MHLTLHGSLMTPRFLEINGFSHSICPTNRAIKYGCDNDFQPLSWAPVLPSEQLKLHNWNLVCGLIIVSTNLCIMEVPLS